MLGQHSTNWSVSAGLRCERLWRILVKALGPWSEKPGCSSCPLSHWSNSTSQPQLGMEYIWHSVLKTLTVDPLATWLDLESPRRCASGYACEMFSERVNWICPHLIGWGLHSKEKREEGAWWATTFICFPPTDTVWPAAFTLLLPGLSTLKDRTLS